MEEQKKIKRVDRNELLKDLERVRLYKWEEVCELIGITKPTLFKAIKLGRITPLYIGRLMRISVDEVNKFVGTHALTVKEVSSVLCVSEIKVRSMIREGKLKAVRIADNGAFRIPAQEVDNFIKESTNKNVRAKV